MPDSGHCLRGNQIQVGQGQGQAWRLSRAWGALAATCGHGAGEQGWGDTTLPVKKEGYQLVILRATDKLAGRTIASGPYRVQGLGHPHGRGISKAHRVYPAHTLLPVRHI